MSQAPLDREEQIKFMENASARRVAAIKSWSSSEMHQAALLEPAQFPTPVLVSITNVEPKITIEEELVNKIKEIMYGHEGPISLCRAMGILETTKMEIFLDSVSEAK